MTFLKPLRMAFAGLAVALTLVLPGAARAQEPSQAKLALAGEIVDLKGAMQVFELLIPGVVETSKNNLLAVNPMLFKDVTAVADQLKKEFAPRLSQLKAEIVKIYADRFTEQELKDTLAFYKSPAGKKVIAEEATFVERTMATAQEWAVKLDGEVLQRFRVEMKKRGHAL